MLVKERQHLFPDKQDIYPNSAATYNADLKLVEDTLYQGQGERAAAAFVRPARYRASAFGLQLAALDIREHSKIHEQVLESSCFNKWVKVNHSNIFLFVEVLQKEMDFVQVKLQDK